MLDMKVLTILIVFVCLQSRLVLSNGNNTYCYVDDFHPYLDHGTKTAYDVHHGTVKNSTVQGCRPLQLWILARHGSRYPSKSEIKSMIHKLPRIQKEVIKNHEVYANGSLCRRDLENLRKWVLDPNLEGDRHKYLTEMGKAELHELGRRFTLYYPELFEYDPPEDLGKKYRFRSTDSERTIESMQYFIKGAFPNVTINNTEVVPNSEDTLLKIYEICKPWLEQVNHNGTKSREAEKFMKTPIFREVAANVSRRLGFPSSLSQDDVRTIYLSCIFETAWHVYQKKSPWCAAFTEEELKVYEYEEDLEYYYYASYGTDINPRVGCHPLKDMIDRFMKVEQEDPSEKHKGIFYFAHSTMLQLALTSMGVAKDSQPLTAYNYEKMGDRKWRTSLLAPFTGNLAAIFYKCDDSHKVRFYLNERPLEYEGCTLGGVCDWEYIKMKLGPIASNCSVDFCTK